jgi:hypothetical protein
MNIRTARYDQLNLFLLQITAKTRELGGARAVLIAHGTAPNAGRIRLIDKTLGDLATVERMVVNEMLRRYRLGGWTIGHTDGVMGIVPALPGESGYAGGMQPAGAVYGAPQGTPKLGIYEATSGRMLLVSRAMTAKTRPAGAPGETIVVSTPAGPVTVMPERKTSSAGSVALGLLATVSMAASAYHGIKRNNGSIPYGIWWGLMGTMFPVITPTIAVAQGYAKPLRS